MHEDLAATLDAIFPDLRNTLEDLVRIPSVSADGFDPEQVRRSARAASELLEDAGLTGVRLLEIEGAHPAVFGEIPGPAGSPTVLLYAHHDVQPPGPAEEWHTDPFEPFESEGRLYGRGVTDNKSGVVVHLGAIRVHHSQLPVGIKVFFEGEEEIGSEHLAEYLETYGDLLAADVIVIADSGNIETGTPSLTTSLRGLVDCVVEVRVLEKAAHSGNGGGLVPDALMAMARLLASLHNDDGSVAVSDRVRSEPKKFDLTEQRLRDELRVLDGVEFIGSGSYASRMWTQPSISILALDAPPVSEAINQLVPAARAKVSMRIAPGDEPQAAMEALVAHLESHAPWGVSVIVTPGTSGEAFALDASAEPYDAFRKGFDIAWDSPAVEIGVGGSIPFVAAFSARFPAATIVLTGAGDDKSDPHAPNESVSLEELRRAMLGEAIALRLLAAD